MCIIQMCMCIILCKLTIRFDLYIILPLPYTKIILNIYKYTYILIYRNT